jgi:hypothetical protein
MDTSITVAVIGLFGTLIVALLENVKRKNSKEHAFVVTTLEEKFADISKRFDLIAKGLGRSIDTVGKTASRTEEKIDEHIADHARGEFVKE